MPAHSKKSSSGERCEDVCCSEWTKFCMFLLTIPLIVWSVYNFQWYDDNDEYVSHLIQAIIFLTLAIAIWVYLLQDVMKKNKLLSKEDPKKDPVVNFIVHDSFM